MLFLLAGPVLAQDAVETEPPLLLTEPSPPAELRLLSTGGNRGIGSGTYAFGIHEQAARLAQLAEVHAEHGWLAQGPWLVAADSHGVADVLKLLEGGGPRCEPIESARVVRTPEEVLLVQGPVPSWIEDLGRTPWPIGAWSCTREGVSGVLFGPKEQAPASWDVTTWEFRLALELGMIDGSTLHTVGVPDREGTRMFAALERVAQAGDVLYVDAGDFVDGASSVRNDAMSLHRPAAFAMLRRLSPTALAPGHNELVGGAKGFFAESTGLPYVATNWRSEDPALQLPDRRVVEWPLGDETVRVGIVAALDPGLVDQIPLLKREGIALVNPVDAVQPVVDALRTSGVQLVILLTTAEPRLLASLHAELTGVDAIVGDTRANPLRLASQQLVLRGPDVGGAPVLPARGVMASAVTLHPEGGIQTLMAVPLQVTETMTPDPATLAAVSAVRAREYPALDHPLLPAPPDAPLGMLPRAAWTKLVCEAVLEGTRADLVLLPDLPTGRDLPGALTELIVGDWLATGDHLEVHHVLGSQFPRLLDQLFGYVPVSCGAELGVKAPKARGRLLESERVYRVVTTDRLRESTSLGTLLQAARPLRKLEQPGYHGIEVDDVPQTLRSVALESLRELRDTHEDGMITDLLKRSSADKPPQWLLRVREASVRIEGFEGAEDEAYAEVPETLVTSPSSFTIGSAADIALDYSSRGLNWDLRGRSVFTRLKTAEATQETADDVKLSMSTNLPGLGTPGVLGLSFSPYAEGLLDSEWTKVEDAEQRQADVSLTVGLAAKRLGMLRVLRVGALANKDVAVFAKQPEFGARLELQTVSSFGLGLTWANQLDGFVYGDTRDQDASDLRFKTQLDSRLALPLARWLDLAVYGRGFVFQGRVESTRNVRWSGSLGAALDVSGAFQLNR